MTYTNTKDGLKAKITFSKHNAKYGKYQATMMDSDAGETVGSILTNDLKKAIEAIKSFISA